MHNAEARQAIPKLANEIDTDDVSRLIALFDATFEAHKAASAAAARIKQLAKDTRPRYVSVTGSVELGLFAANEPNAEYALRLWCSANGITLDVSDYVHDGSRWHVIRAQIDNCRLISIQQSWPLDIGPRIVADEDQMWRPAP